MSARKRCGATIRVTPPTRVAVAYHEAGHVLAAFAWGAGIRWVNIGSAGDIRRGAFRGETRERARAVDPDDLARCALAGWAAECVYVGRKFLPVELLVGEDDVDAARAALAGDVGEPDVLLLYFLRLSFEQVRRFMRAHREHLDAVARALLRRGHLDEADVLEVLPLRPMRWRRRSVDPRSQSL